MEENAKTSKEEKKAKRNNFVNRIGTIVLGTTISLIVTIVAAQILERNHRAKDRRLSALMVMSNIESYARILESAHEYMERADTVSAWLLNLPLNEVDSFSPVARKTLQLQPQLQNRPQHLPLPQWCTRLRKSLKIGLCLIALN